MAGGNDGVESNKCGEDEGDKHAHSVGRDIHTFTDEIMNPSRV